MPLPLRLLSIPTMKKLSLLCILTLLYAAAHCQTGWKKSANDSIKTNLCLIESTSSGTLFQLIYDYSQLPFSYLLQAMDSTGAVTTQASVQLTGDSTSIRNFRIDTVQQRLLIATQSADTISFTMTLMVMDYNLSVTDSASFSLLKTTTDSCDFIGGGIDLSANKFLIYRYRNSSDQIWSRGVSRKNAAGTYKSVTAKVGQAANDGYYINDFAVMPTGNLYIAGARKESQFGNFFFLEKLNSSMSNVFEVKDQLIQFNADDTHASSIHVYTNAANSQVVVSGSIYGLAPGDTMNRCHGVIRCYNYKGILKWNYQNFEAADYTKVVSKSSYVHAVGSASNNPGGFDTKIIRLFLKDGVVLWERYYGNKSKARDLKIEADGSLLICGDKRYNYPLQGAGNLETRSYMLLRYSKFGKKLYDFNYSWNLPFNPVALTAGFTDLATGRSTLYYAAGSSSIIYEDINGVQYADSLLLQQFINGSLRTGSSGKNTTSLNIRPNPARTEINFSSYEQITDMLIVSNEGRMMPLKELQQEDTHYRYDISELPAGIYVLKIQTASGWSTEKFIKE